MLINEKLRITITLPDPLLSQEEVQDIFLGLIEHIFENPEKNLQLQYSYQKNGKTVRTSKTPSSKFEVEKLQALPDTRIYCISIAMNKSINSIELLADITNEIKKIKAKVDYIGMKMSFNIGTHNIGHGFEKGHAIFNFFISEDISKSVDNTYDDEIGKNEELNLMIHNFNQRPGIPQGFFIQGSYKKFYLLTNNTTILVEKAEDYLTKFVERLGECGSYDESHTWTTVIDQRSKAPVMHMSHNQYISKDASSPTRYLLLSTFTLKEKATQ